MAQTNFTPISLYYSTTATNVPSAANLVAGELAINTQDGKLFYKDAAGVVQTIASKDVNSGTFTNISVSGVASFADGTVSLPSITNIGDTNTGIFFPAADTIAFTEGGTEAMRIDSSGDVGIGTTSPGGYKLAVGDGSSNRGRIMLKGATSGSYPEINIDDTMNASGKNYQIYSTGGHLKVSNQTDNAVSFVANAFGIGLADNAPVDGDGIRFPATQSASSNANTLDDYEEGNWTPVVQGVTTPGTASYTSQIGRYVKIGRQVTITLDINYSSATGTGIFQIAGLPFSSSSAHPSTGSVMTSNLDWNTGTMVTLYKPGNNAVLELYSSSDNSGWLQMNMDAAGEIIGSVTYFTAT
jgi:hypothetical protein